ncbi:MAG: photosynthesis system II assembly factor Ycf48 [Spirulina sp. SIO3F2]|nr:photosynthesis system II assembly factor Ycf48 [Spirulina sp. SIO3F2]
MNMLLKRFAHCLMVVLLALGCIGCSNVPSLSTNPWQIMNLPTDASLYDLAFTGDPNHGWLVGSRSTLFETFDRGQTWQPRQIELGDEKINFTGVSFFGQEGWIVGKPSILLHTLDGGKNWTRIVLSSKLPGAPYSILALGKNAAEMATDVGAIYKTTDGAKNWKALVQEAVGVVRNLQRSPSGEYVAVSSRGNFYSTWTPGDIAWEPHNRNSSRRLQNIGFGRDGRQWLLARGGQIQFSDSGEDGSWGEVIYPEPSTSWGFLDIGYRTADEMWLSGGSGNLLVSTDGGQTWQKDRAVENAPANLYRILFQDADHGFILGDRGVLLRYTPST